MKNQKQIGIILGIGCYLMWGALVYYWHLLSKINSIEVFSYRILFTIVSMFLYFIVSKKTKKLNSEMKALINNKRSLSLAALASLFLGINWLVFIYAVTINEATQASIAGFIMPLVSVVLALIFLHEQFDRFMVISLLLAATGVILMISSSGQFPLLTIIMSVCFPIYGLLKKFYRLSSDVAMVFESSILMPFILIYLIFFAKHALWNYSPSTIFYLVLSGPVTAVPLLLFAESIKRAPLSLIGFIQYLNPIVSLVLSVTVLGESLSKADAKSLIFICAGILIFAIGEFILAKKKQVT